jgi:DNA primase
VYSDSHDVRERIRQAIDIVDLVGEQIELRRQGRNFVGLCPWHADSRPSLQVNPSRQSWKCWVCDLGGDIFSFVMQREKVGFREALVLLADKAGVVLEAGPATRPALSGSVDDKATLYQAMAWACDQFHQFLLTAPEAAPGRAYLASRKINPDSVQRFRLGFVPQAWQWLLDRAAKSAFSPELLSAVGLTVQSERSGRWLDRFRGRVMFPILDPQGRPIAVGGRILPEYADEKTAKYINSPETRLFSKSEQLYGLHLARDVVSRQREVIVMEGYTDVVIAHQHGLANAVAVLGTALGPRHLQLIRRFADRVTLLLDGDAAGQRRASEILELFLANQIDLRVVTLPGNLDPCDFLIEQGSDALNTLVAQAPDAWDYKFQLETRGIDLVRDTHRAHRALENLLRVVASMSRSARGDLGALRLREQHLLNRLARDFHLDEDELRQRLADLRRRRPASSTLAAETTPAAAKPRLEPSERELFEAILQQPDAAGTVFETLRITQLKTATARQLYQVFSQLRDAGQSASFSSVLLAVDDPAMKSLLVELDEAGQQKHASDHQQVFHELLQTFNRRSTEEQLQRQQAELESDQLDEQQQQDMLLRIIHTRQEMMKP